MLPPFSATSLESFLTVVVIPCLSLGVGVRELLRHLPSTEFGTQQVLTNDDRINERIHY